MPQGKSPKRKSPKRKSSRWSPPQSRSRTRLKKHNVFEDEGTFQVVLTNNKNNPVESMTFILKNDRDKVIFTAGKVIGKGTYGIIQEFKGTDGLDYAVKIIKGGIHAWWTEQTATRMLRDVNCGQVRAREVISPNNPDVAAKKAVGALPDELCTVEFVAQCAAISAVAAIPMPLTVNVAISFALDAAKKAVSTMFSSALSEIVQSNIERAVASYVATRQNEDTDAAIQNAAIVTAFTEQDRLEKKVDYYYSSCEIGHAVSKDKSTPYISIMPRLHGNLHDLKTLLQKSRSMDIPQAVRITESVRQQVSCLIQKNKMFVYTDMKPANIMYTMDEHNEIKIYMGDLGSLVPGLHGQYLLTYPCILTSTKKEDESAAFMKLPTVIQREECLAYELGIIFCSMLPMMIRLPSLQDLAHSAKHTDRVRAIGEILKTLESQTIKPEWKEQWNNAVRLLHTNALKRHSIHKSLYGTGGSRTDIRKLGT